VVASVDGIDVLNGSVASRSNACYVLRPHSELKIEGFRKVTLLLHLLPLASPQMLMQRIRITAQFKIQVL
jgi:hypothetical protein